MMKLTGKEAREILFHMNPDWKEVEGTEKPISHSRWSVGYSAVYLHVPTDKYYKFYRSRGATEMQEEMPYDYEDEVEVEAMVFREYP